MNISSVWFVQSAKILLLPPKYEIIMVLSNHSYFQYCDSNIKLIFIPPCKVITLNPLCSLFGISSLLLIWWLSFNYRDSFRSFSVLKAIAKRLSLLFANAFKERKRATTIAVAIVGRAITIWEAIEKRSHEPTYKTYTKKQRD